MTPRVEQLGFALVKGLSWTLADTVQVTDDGVVGDRHWSPVTPDPRCIKATDFPEMVGPLWASSATELEERTRKRMSPSSATWVDRGRLTRRTPPELESVVGC